MTSLSRKDTEPAEVRAVETPQVLPLLHPGSASLQSYQSLSQCLRTNTFPGPSLTWRSLTQDSYTSHPLTPPDPSLWFGHKTDETAEWTEKNFMNQKLNKLLTEIEKKGTAK